jgi:hypothetical protein
MTQSKINDELERFHADPYSPTPVAEQKTPRYVIATSSAFSVGLTLTEAIAIIFLEPDFKAETMAQGFSRHWRQGNKNEVVHSFLLLAQANNVEDRIMTVNKLRAGIEKAATRKVNEEINPNNDSGNMEDLSADDA